MKIKNILNLALRIIPQSPIKYRKATGITTNEFGQKVNTYGEWIEATGVVQPGIVASFGSRNISEIQYKDLGLDFARSNITVWISDVRIMSVLGSNTDDQLLYDGKIWNVIRVAGWNEYNGWRRCYCQEALNLDIPHTV